MDGIMDKYQDSTTRSGLEVKSKSRASWLPGSRTNTSYHAPMEMIQDLPPIDFGTLELDLDVALIPSHRPEDEFVDASIPRTKVDMIVEESFVPNEAVDNSVNSPPTTSFVLANNEDSSSDLPLRQISKRPQVSEHQHLQRQQPQPSEPQYSQRQQPPSFEGQHSRRQQSEPSEAQYSQPQQPQPSEDQQPRRQQPRKPMFRHRFWAFSSSNDFSHSKEAEKSPKPLPPQPREAMNSTRMVYVPRHAATDFSALSSAQLRTSLSSQQEGSSPDSLRSRASSSSMPRGPTPLSATTVGSEVFEKGMRGSDEQSQAMNNHMPEPCHHEQSQKAGGLAGGLDVSNHSLRKRSMSDISIQPPSDPNTSLAPTDTLPPTSQDFALFAAQARSNDRSCQSGEAAAAWASLMQLQGSRAEWRRRSLDSIASSFTAVHPYHQQRRLSVAYSDDSVTLANDSVAMAYQSLTGARPAPVAVAAVEAEQTSTVVKRIQQRHQQQVAQAHKGIGHRIAAYIRPPRINNGYAPARR